MKKTIYALGLSALSVVSGAYAQSDSTKKEDGKFTVSGYIDSYYLHALNNPMSGNLMGYQANYGTYYGQPLPANGFHIPGYALGSGRAFDRLTDQFALGLVQTKFAYSNKKSDMVIDLTFGPNAELGNFGNQRFIPEGGYATGFYPNNNNQSVLYNTSAAIKQAYFTYKFTDKLNFTMGQFGTHVGYEVIDAPVNYNYSLSNLFNNGPFYHIGGKVNYAVSDKIALMLGLVNNWDALTDWKKQKSTIAQIFLNPLSGWNVYLNYIGGFGDDGFKVNPGSSTGAGSAQLPYTPFPSGYVRNLFDLTTGYQVTDKVYFGLNAAYGWYDFNTTSDSIKASIVSETGANNTHHVDWGGIALYSNYKFNDMFGIGIRLEHFDDKHHVRYIGTVNNSITVTAPITLADGHLQIKPEVRADFTPTQNFYENADGTGRANQTTIGCAFIYKY